MIIFYKDCGPRLRSVMIDDFSQKAYPIKSCFDPCFAQHDGRDSRSVVVC